VLLPKDNKLLIKCKVTNSVRISWLKPTNEGEQITYRSESYHPMPLHRLSTKQDTTIFFNKNDATYVYTYKNKKLIATFYNYKKESYSLLGIDDSHIESVGRVESYVKAPNGDVFLYYVRGITENEGNEEGLIGIYNYSQKKIVYEVKSNENPDIIQPIANSITVVLTTKENTIYIDVINLLNGHKYKISYHIKDYFIKLSQLVKNKKDIMYIQEIIKGTDFDFSLYDLKYSVNTDSSGTVFFESSILNIEVTGRVKASDWLIEIKNAIVILCSLKNKEFIIKLSTANNESMTLFIPKSTVVISIPSEIELLIKKYKVDVPNDLSKSHLYSIKDLFGNYVFAGTRLLKLSSNVGSNDTFDEYYTVSNVSRLEGINIYNTFVGSTQKFLASLNPTSLAHEPKIGTRSIYEETYKVYAIDLYKLYNIISSRKINKTYNKQYMDIIQHITIIDVWPLISSNTSFIYKFCSSTSNRLHKHKIYLDEKTGNLYLSMLVSCYRNLSDRKNLYILIYKINIKNTKGTYRNVLTLGPYDNIMLTTASDRFLSRVMKDIILYDRSKSPHQYVPLYLVEELIQKNTNFIYDNEIKLNFEYQYANIIDVKHNRRSFLLAKDASSKTNIHIRRYDRILVCTDMGLKYVLYGPVVFSRMGIVKSIDQGYSKL